MLKDFFWRKSFTRFPASGIIIILIVTILTLLGIIILFSASQAMHSNPVALLKKQILWLVLGIIIGFFVFRLDLERIRSLIPIITGAALLLLALVLIPGIGVKVNGAQRWLDLGLMRLQVSEIGKIGLLFCLAHYLAMHRRSLDAWKEGFIYPFFTSRALCWIDFFGARLWYGFSLWFSRRCFIFCFRNQVTLFITVSWFSFALILYSHRFKSRTVEPNYLLFRC